jgi:hypothetical protein
MDAGIKNQKEMNHEGHEEHEGEIPDRIYRIEQRSAESTGSS